MMKKVVVLLLVMLFIIPINAFASDVNGSGGEVPSAQDSKDFASLNESTTVEGGEYICVDDTDGNLTVQSVDGQIEPLSTCSGNGGYARIEPVFGPGGAVSWEINPRFSTVHTFMGSLVITKYVGQTPVPYKNIPVICSGAAGAACGDDYVSLNLPKGHYGVALTGTAKDLSGLFSWIVPPCDIGITVG